MQANDSNNTYTMPENTNTGVTGAIGDTLGGIYHNVKQAIGLESAPEEQPTYADVAKTSESEHVSTSGNVMGLAAPFGKDSSSANRDKDIEAIHQWESKTGQQTGRTTRSQDHFHADKVREDLERTSTNAAKAPISTYDKVGHRNKDAHNTTDGSGNSSNNAFGMDSGTSSEFFDTGIRPITPRPGDTSASASSARKASDAKDGAMAGLDQAKQTAGEWAESAKESAINAKDSTAETLAEYKDFVAEKLGEYKDSTAAKLTSAKDSAAETLTNAKDSAGQKLSDAKESMVAMKDAAAEKLDSMGTPAALTDNFPVEGKDYSVGNKDLDYGVGMRKDFQKMGMDAGAATDNPADNLDPDFGVNPKGFSAQDRPSGGLEASQRTSAQMP